MKKIVTLLLGVMIFTSCKPTQDVVTTPVYAAPPPKDTAQVAVPGIYGLIIIQPVNDSVVDGKNRFDQVYDYANRAIHIFDNTDEYHTMKQSLPSVITVNNIDSIYPARLASSTADPFASITKDTRQTIAQKEGLEFGTINQYRIALNWGTKRERIDYQLGLGMLSDMLQEKNTPSTGSSSKRKAVEGFQSLLTYHPTKLPIKILNGKTYYSLLDLNSGCLYFTEDKAVYDQIFSALEYSLDNTNAVILQGIAIKPAIYFNDKSLEAMTTDQKLDIKGTEGSDLNKYRVLRLTAYAVVKDYRKVAEKISKILNPVSTSSGKKSTQPPPPAQNTPPNSQAKPVPAENKKTQDKRRSVVYPNNVHQ